MTRISESEKKRIEEMYRDGMSQEDIANRIGCSQPTVSLHTKEESKSLVWGEADGYECVKQSYQDGPVYIHRLLACADHSLSHLQGKLIHHKNGVEWDNRPGNIEVVTPKEHQERHE